MSLKKFERKLSAEEEAARAAKNAKAKKPRTKRNRKIQWSEIRHEEAAM